MSSVLATGCALACGGVWGGVGGGGYLGSVQSGRVRGGFFSRHPLVSVFPGVLAVRVLSGRNTSSQAGHNNYKYIQIIDIATKALM